MENNNNNKKKKNILAIILGAALVVVTTFGVLLYTGVVKSPMIKEKKCTSKTTNTNNTNKTDSNVETKNDDLVTGVRYFQGCYVSTETEQEVDRCTEIVLYDDGTAKQRSINTPNAKDYEGVFIEDSDYVGLFFNNAETNCMVNYTGQDMGVSLKELCSSAIILSKEGDNLKTVYGKNNFYNFKADEDSAVFKKTIKENLKTSLKEE